MTGGGTGKTFADTNSITAAEVIDLFHSLSEPYHPGVWTMRQATFASLQGLTGNQFQLITPPQMGDGINFGLLGQRVFPSQYMGAMTTGLKAVAFANWDYYALVENVGLTVTRNPYIYESTGYVALYSRARWGGGVLQADAVKLGVLA